MEWKKTLLNFFNRHIHSDLQNNTGFVAKEPGIHLAVFTEPFLTLLLIGDKTVESRFSTNRISPFHRVQQGDVVFIKQSSGPICGYFFAGKTLFYEIKSENEIGILERKYSKGICASSEVDFWERRKHAKYVSLIEVNSIKTITPFVIDKRDRMSWVTIRNSLTNDSIEF